MIDSVVQSGPTFSRGRQVMPSVLWPTIRCAMLAGLGSLATFLGACATVTRGTTQEVRIESQPAGATVTLSNGMKGVTPVVFELHRKDTIWVEFRMKGYVRVTKSIGPVSSKAGDVAYTGNAIIGGAIGGMIDNQTGAARDLWPNPLVVEMKLRPAPRPWAKLERGATLDAVRALLGSPKTIAGGTQHLWWTYDDAGRVHFTELRVVDWDPPAEVDDDPPENRSVTQPADATPAVTATVRS